MVPFVDLRAQHDSIREELFEAITGIVDKSSFIMGPAVKEFEAAFAEFCGCKYAIGCSSGTSALRLALQACGVGCGDEIITIPHTFIATAEAATILGAKVVFVEIDPETYTMDVSKLEAAITDKTKVILPVHLYGHPTDMGPLMAIAKKHNLKVVEDCAQAHGAQYNGKTVGTIGDMGCFSFFPAKNLGAMGDAGAVVTNNEELAFNAGLMRNHGREKKYEHMWVGYNERLDTLQAAILNVKLPHLAQWNENRRARAAEYKELLAGVESVLTPVERPGCKHVYHLYVIRHANRDGLQSFLKEKGVASGIHYPLPLHMQPAYASLGYKQGDFPETEKAATEILSLPIYPEMKTEHVEEAVSAIKQFAG